MRTRVGVVLLAVAVLTACGPKDTDEKATGESAPASAPSAPKAPDSAPTASASAPSQRESKPSESTSKPSESASVPAGSVPAPKTKEAAIERYEEYLHALGRQDIDTVCEIAGPGAKQAEAEGFGPCEVTFRMVFQMISPVQKAALVTATVDPARVIVGSPVKVDIPVGAIRADVTFGEDELGDSTLEYLDDDWFITG